MFQNNGGDGDQDTTFNNRKPHLLVYIAIMSKFTAIERRMAVRSTWMKTCKLYPKDAVCRFFTDQVKGQNQTYQVEVSQESKMYKDLSFMPYKGMILNVLLLSNTAEPRYLDYR